MCFSAEADIVTGVAVGVVGVDCLRHVSDRRELPLASLPLLIVRGPVDAHNAGHRLAYDIGGTPEMALTVLSVIATCGVLLASTSRPIRILGVANLVAVSALAVLTTGNIASLWCAWAAVSSIAIALHLRSPHRVRLA